MAGHADSTAEKTIARLGCRVMSPIIQRWIWHGALTGLLASRYSATGQTNRRIETEPIRRRTQRAFLKSRDSTKMFRRSDFRNARSVRKAIKWIAGKRSHRRETESAPGAAAIICPLLVLRDRVQSGGCARRQRCVAFAGTLPGRKICRANHLPLAAMDGAWSRSNEYPICTAAF